MTPRESMRGRIRGALRRARSMFRRRWYAGARRVCPICGFHARRFLPQGVKRRPEARCPSCNSFERHRLAWLFFRERTALLDGTEKRVLHVAPEACLERRLRRALGSGYVTADLLDPTADVRMDLMEIQYPEGSFDVIYCSHVLEHVPDDRQAMRELHRVMAPGGWGMINVPISAEATDEDPSVTDPAERLRRFGQEDHVRCYGPDYYHRLGEAGFEVTVVGAADVAPAADLERYGIPVTEELCICTRPGGVDR